MDGLAALTSVDMKDFQRSGEEFHHGWEAVPAQRQGRLHP